MGLLHDCPEFIIATIQIMKKGPVTGNGPGGPIYGPDVECYNDRGVFDLLSGSEAIVYDTLGNPATHYVMIFPELITQSIDQGSWAVVDGVEYALLPGSPDILGTGDVGEYLAVKRA